MQNVCIIGAGVVGGLIARELSKYDLRVCLVESQNDVATGATKANSGIVHAGFDAEEGTLKAKLNVEGSKMMKELCEELNVKYKNNGSMVLAFSEEENKSLEILLDRGVKNGVEKLRILSKEEAKKLEPNLSNDVYSVLYAPTGGIVCPYDLTISAIGNAMDNGVTLERNFLVNKIEEKEDYFILYSIDGKSIATQTIINCAGVYADEIAKMIGDNSFDIIPKKGEYLLLDKTQGNKVSCTIFQTPTEKGKGILVSPTVDGNLLLGPTSVVIDDKENKQTTEIGLNQVITQSKKSVDGVNVGKVITSFTGLRASTKGGDFIINSPKKGFINVAGIDSPGLSSSPAIAKLVGNMVKEIYPNLKPNNRFNPKRNFIDFRRMTREEKNEIIKKNPSFGKIVCRCEGVSEGEILQAIRLNPKPLDLDGVKRRTRAQMGRCQGGFCSPYIIKLLAKEQGKNILEITKNGLGSKVVFSKTKEENND